MDYSEQDTRDTEHHSFHPLQFAFLAIVIVLMTTFLIGRISKPTPHAIPIQPLPHITQAILTSSPWQQFTVTPGDNLVKLFIRANIDMQTYYKIIQLPPVKNALTSLQPGEHIYFVFDKKHQLEKMAYRTDDITYLYIASTKDGFTAHFIEQHMDKKRITTSGVIHQSFDTAARKAGLPTSVNAQLANIFSWDINFAKQIHENDIFKVIYEEYTVEGKNIKPGDVIAAELINRNKIYKAIRYETNADKVSYYTPSGKNLKRAFLRFPLKFKRISSPFNEKRLDPILHIVRPHLGVDLAAPMGTPIKASADGRIIFRGRMGGYGKIVILQHTPQYSTRYAHMSRFATGEYKGSYVKQGQVIGYVGQTGFATGPHLHYEFRINGIAHNPVTTKLPSADPIPKKECASFSNYAKKISTELDNIKI